MPLRKSLLLAFQLLKPVLFRPAEFVECGAIGRPKLWPPNAETHRLAYAIKYEENRSNN
jgi:hypothetical protein